MTGDFPPTKVFVPSDDNELQLVEVLPKDRFRKDVMYLYEYLVSATRKGSRLLLSEADLRKNIKAGIFRQMQ